MTLPTDRTAWEAFTAPAKIYHPLTGVYVGLIYRDEQDRILAEDRDVDVTDHDTFQGAINWLCRQTTMTLGPAWAATVDARALGDAAA